MDAAKPPTLLEKLPPAKLDAGTGVPVPLEKPFTVLYSIPYAVMAAQAVVAVPASVAELEVMALAAPVVTTGAGLIPDPTAATLMDGKGRPRQQLYYHCMIEQVLA